jgi:hypothetical protein
MTIAEPMLLPEDVVITPVDELPPEIREQVEHGPGDRALTRPLSRTPSTIVDRDTAGLLDAFRTPTRIVDAIVGFAAERRLDPHEILERSFPVLRELLVGGYLVPADSALARPIAEAALADGTTIGRFRVERTVHLLIDTQVCLATDEDGQTPVALKVARAGHEGSMRPALAHEAAVLRELGGVATPDLIDEGDADGRPYLAMAWRPGSGAEEAAAELRHLPPAVGRAALLRLGARILAAYDSIHGRGVLHGDVHPNNVIVGPDGAVTLIDFGLAASAGRRAGPRGGIDFFMEPESAYAGESGRGAAPLTARGEQYGVAALLYRLLTGGHTHAFSLEPSTMRRQLLEDPPLPFSRHGVDGLPAVEAVLRRALAKDPDDRFADMATFLAAYDAAVERDVERAVPQRSKRAAKGSAGPRTAAAPVRDAGAEEAGRLLEEVLDRVGLDGPLLGSELEAPRASVNLGAAGIAYALLRIATARDDAELLALASLWSLKATAALGTEEAFVNPALDITPADFGTSGIHHSATGVYAVEAAIAGARWDPLGRAAAIDGFLGVTSEPGPERDVSFGRSGILLATAGLVEALPVDDPQAAALRERGDTLATGLWAELARQGPLRISIPARGSIPGDPRPVTERMLGAAHGWAGHLYAQLRWAEASGGAPPDGVKERLEELGHLALPLGRGLVWPRELGAPDDGALAASWCNGAAGHVFLWSLASRLVDDAYARLAEGAAWTALEAAPVPGDLCCGLAGRAYALLALHRATGERIWLARARVLAEGAAAAVREHALRPDSLYKGTIGVAVLAADLERSDEAAMPFFEREPWADRA